MLLAAVAGLSADVFLTARRLAEAAYKAAAATHQAHRGDPQAAAEFGRAAFDLGELATNNSERALLAEQGIAACRKALEKSTNAAAVYYYLGLNVGQLARTRGMGALSLVDDLEGAFKKARALDEHYDYAGSDRNLGLLYRDAPPLLSVGSRSKARTHLERAVKLEPNYPDNRLSLLEAYVSWKDRPAAKRELAALDSLWPAALTNFAGPQWAVSWIDWSNRLATARTKAGDTRKNLKSPHDR